MPIGTFFKFVKKHNDFTDQENRAAKGQKVVDNETFINKFANKK